MRRIIPCLVVTIAQCAATTPAPYSVQCAVLDKIPVYAKKHPDSQLVAFGLLKLLAEDRKDAAASKLEVQVGRPAGQLNNRDFRSQTVRACALQRIGQLEFPEAQAYLQHLTLSQFAPDEVGYLWPAAQIALRKSLLKDITGEPAQIAFLERVLTEHHDAFSDSKVSTWAVEELCNRGSVQSLSVIRASILRRNRIHGNDEIQFCEERITSLSRSPDQVAALASLLTVRNEVTKPNLTGWAINRLSI